MRIKSNRPTIVQPLCVWCADDMQQRLDCMFTSARPRGRRRNVMAIGVTGPALNPGRGRRGGVAAYLLTAALCLSTLQPVVAQEVAPTPRPPASPTPQGPADDYSRGVPRTATRGFMEACWAGDFERAA